MGVQNTIYYVALTRHHGLYSAVMWWNRKSVIKSIERLLLIFQEVTQESGDRQTGTRGGSFVAHVRWSAGVKGFGMWVIVNMWPTSGRLGTYSVIRAA